VSDYDTGGTSCKKKSTSTQLLLTAFVCHKLSAALRDSGLRTWLYLKTIAQVGQTS